MSTGVSNVAERRLFILNSSDGAVLHEMVGPPQPPTLSDDEAHVYGATFDTGGRFFAKFDVSNGMEVGRLALPPNPPSGTIGVRSVVVDERRQRAIVSLSSCVSWECSGIYWTIDTDTMTEVARVPTTGPAILRPDNAAGDVVGVAARVNYGHSGGCFPGHLQMVTMADGLVRSSAGPFPTFGDCVASAIATPPGSTELATAMVTGSTAKLSWYPLPARSSISSKPVACPGPRISPPSRRRLGRRSP